MQDIIDKRLRADTFRARLAQAMGDANATQSGLARQIGVDRSTISQLLTREGARLPNAHHVRREGRSAQRPCRRLLLQGPAR